MELQFKISPVFVHKFAKEYLDMTELTYNPPLSSKTRTIDVGLTIAETQKLFPQLLGVAASNEKFFEKVREFLVDLEWKIPAEGSNIKINVDADGMPDDIHAYLLYKSCTIDASVAKTPEEHKFADGKVYRYKLEDLKVIEKKEEEDYNKIKTAVVFYATLTNSAPTDETKLPLIKQILTLNKEALVLGVDEIADMSKIKAEIELKKLLDKFPNKLIEAKANKDTLAILAQIELFYYNNLISLEGDAVYCDGIKVASNRAALVGVLKSDSTLYSTLMSRLRAASSKVDKILPEPEVPNETK